jgi:hypothetical protein
MYAQDSVSEAATRSYGHYSSSVLRLTIWQRGRGRACLRSDERGRGTDELATRVVAMGRA